MKICFISYEYDPFPGGGIATYHNIAAKKLVEAGHEVHFVTNSAWHGSNKPSCTHRRWQEGNLHIHRLFYFDENRGVPDNANFLDVVPSRYGHDNASSWANHPSNQAAYQAALYVEALHSEVGLDVIESPEYFGETFYILRRRAAGERHRFPPVCLHGHVSSRISFGACQYTWELGYYQHRQMMLREEYCLQQADALITPSRSLMRRYEETFGDRLPELRDTFPYFLEIPEEPQTLPQGLGTGRYLVTIGRVEPRKGSDLVIKAFGALANDYPDLKLVMLGKENWHYGETPDDLIAAEVDKQHHGRIIRPGNLPREQALALARKATAFLHPAAWDNYPCAVMEAMAVGSVCIVSDQGGQSEMVEDGKSGLIIGAGDHEALIASIRKVLDDDSLCSRLSQGAVERMAEITSPEPLIEKKIRIFQELCDREAKATTARPRLPWYQQAKSARPKLPGVGMVLIDAGKAGGDSVNTTKCSVLDELQSSPDWSVTLLADPGQEVNIPGTWSQIRASGQPPWLDLDPETTLVYVLAGTRFDVGKMSHLVQQVHDSHVPCGSFLWLRTAQARLFPYSPDLGHHDLMVGGRILPPVFAIKARYLQQCNFLSGLFDPHQRLCALMSAASLTHDLMFRHTGTVCGDFYGDLPLVREDMQLRTMGYLDILDQVPRRLCTIGNIQIPTAPTAEVEEMINEARRQGREEANSGEAAPIPAPRTQGGTRVDERRLAELEGAYGELQALKQNKAVKLIRKLGLFDLARKLCPKSKGVLGKGNKPD